MELLHKGAIGEVLIAKAWNSQLRRNIGHVKPSEPPAHLDYDLWVGPAPMTPYIWEPTGIGRWRILRVVTPAWKSLPRFERVHKVRQAVEPNLTPGERAQIFRFSVLTPAELRRLEQMLQVGRRSDSRKSNSNGRHKSARA